jgi:hypothetical protein
MAHKTIALTTELREPLLAVPGTGLRSERGRLSSPCRIIAQCSYVAISFTFLFVPLYVPIRSGTFRVTPLAILADGVAKLYVPIRAE